MGGQSNKKYYAGGVKPDLEFWGAMTLIIMTVSMTTLSIMVLSKNDSFMVFRVLQFLLSY